MQVEASGAVTLCGVTESTNFPVLQQVANFTLRQDAFVVSFNDSGCSSLPPHLYLVAHFWSLISSYFSKGTLEFSTCFGGEKDDVGVAIALDSRFVLT